ncbi:SMEK domain-containing protein [Patescibacteria group bacterium]|nr:SMEK domain-containing protein [Patescibacteria group bacterium]
MLKSIGINLQISDALGVLRNNVEQRGSQCLFDIHKKSEDFFCTFLNEIYNLNLKNLNQVEKNIKGIDLGDKGAGVAYQITSESRSEKIKDTLRSHSTRALEFPELIIFIIGKKSSGGYKSVDFEKEIDGKFNFDKTTQIKDIFDLVNDINQLSPVKWSKLLKILDINIADYIKINLHEPIRLNEEDIKNLVLKLRDEIKNGVIAEMKITKIPTRKDIKIKNIKNNMSSDYFENIVRKNIRHHLPIRSFLSEDANEEVLNCYNSVFNELQEIYISKKDEYYSISEFFQEVYNRVEEKFTKDLGYDKRKIFTLLHYMYFNCDLGINP